MTRTKILLALAVLAHIAWVATYDGGAGDLFGFVFIVLLAAALLPPLVGFLRRTRRRAGG